MNENMQPNNMPMNNMPTGNPPVNNMPSSMHENKSSIGSIIGTVIVIAIIILGGLYFWGKRIDEAKIKQDLVSGEKENVATDDNMEANAIKSVSGSDDYSSIEADLNGTNLNNLGAELQAELE